MRVLAYLRNTVTGEVAVYPDPCVYPDDDVGGVVWIWTGGNFGCDCNRSICFWYGKAGIAQTASNLDLMPDDAEFPCNQGRSDPIIELDKLVDSATGVDLLGVGYER